MFVYIVKEYGGAVHEVYDTRKAAELLSGKLQKKFNGLLVVDKRKVKHMIFNRIKNGKHTTKSTKGT